MILIGVIVNIGIVLIAHVIDLRAAGMDRHQAILQAARDRLRPIMMTTLTTLLAMLPLALGDTQIGGNGPAYYPMARALMAGLAFGSVTSLIFVPMFYVWLDNFSRWRRRVQLHAGRRDRYGRGCLAQQYLVDVPVVVDQDIGVGHAARRRRRQ